MKQILQHNKKTELLNIFKLIKKNLNKLTNKFMFT